MRRGIDVAPRVTRAWALWRAALERAQRRWRGAGGPSTAPLLIAGLALLVRLALLLRGAPALDSDEAIVGLMARHMLHGEWSVFYWGQHYMGTIEPTLVALVFAVTGASAFALRLVPLLCGVVAAVQVYWLGRRMTSRRVALWAGCFCALGSPFFVLWTLRAKGGYIEFIVLGQWLLLLALRPARAGWREAAELGLFGLVVGLALWTNPLSFIYVVAALVALWLRHPVTARIRPAAVGAAVAGCLVGIGPVWWPTLAR